LLFFLFKFKLSFLFSDFHVLKMPLHGFATNKSMPWAGFRVFTTHLAANALCARNAF
jgi:hypothetical protein